MSDHDAPSAPVVCALCGVGHRFGATSCDGCGRSLVATLDAESLRLEFVSHRTRALLGASAVVGLILLNGIVLTTAGAALGAMGLFLALVGPGNWTLIEWTRYRAVARRLALSERHTADSVDGRR